MKKFIKSREKMANELFYLWDNFLLYKFLEGIDYIVKKELEICECLIEKERLDFISTSRVIYDINREIKDRKKK